MVWIWIDRAEQIDWMDTNDDDDPAEAGVRRAKEKKNDNKQEKRATKKKKRYWLGARREFYEYIQKKITRGGVG